MQPVSILSVILVKSTGKASSSGPLNQVTKKVSLFDSLIITD